MTCQKLDTSKYLKRPSPPFAASECRFHVMKGNDGQYHYSTPDKNGVFGWRRLPQGTNIPCSKNKIYNSMTEHCIADTSSNIRSIKRQKERRLAMGMSPTKMSPRKKSPVRKSAKKMSPRKKSPVRKSAKKMSPRKKSPVRKSAKKMSPRKMSPRKMSPRKKSPVRKSAKKMSPRKKSPVKKSANKIFNNNTFQNIRNLRNKFEDYSSSDSSDSSSDSDSDESKIIKNRRANRPKLRIDTSLPSALPTIIDITPSSSSANTTSTSSSAYTTTPSSNSSSSASSARRPQLSIENSPSTDGALTIRNSPLSGAGRRRVYSKRR